MGQNPFPAGRPAVGPPTSQSSAAARGIAAPHCAVGRVTEKRPAAPRRRAREEARQSPPSLPLPCKGRQRPAQSQSSPGQERGDARQDEEPKASYRQNMRLREQKWTRGGGDEEDGQLAGVARTVPGRRGNPPPSTPSEALERDEQARPAHPRGQDVTSLLGVLAARFNTISRCFPVF